MFALIWMNWELERDLAGVTVAGEVVRINMNKPHLKDPFAVVAVKEGVLNKRVTKSAQEGYSRRTITSLTIPMEATNTTTLNTKITVQTNKSKKLLETVDTH
jgi:hypothetical protein